MSRRIATLLSLVLSLTLLPGVPAVLAQDAAPERPDVTVVRTTAGIPHITGDDFESVGFGYGYVFAEDNFCEMMEWYVTIRGERSKYWGEDGEYMWYPIRAYGPKNNLKSDLFFKRIQDRGIVSEFLTQEPPHGPLPDLLDGVQGYADGWNAWLADQGGADGIADPRCRGAAWVDEIEPIDVYTYFYRELLVASSGVFMHAMVDAAPPGGEGASAVFPTEAERRAAIAANPEALPGPHNIDIGSNAYGIGGDATQTGMGMVLGNPHFPWVTSERFYQAHLTIPGTVDIAGASLLGVPLVNIGFNDQVAWSHTVSTAYRFTLYEYGLVPGAPTMYLTEAGPQQMESTTVTVQALTADGTLEERTHTFYETTNGPMISNFVVEGVDIVPWTPAVAYGIRDANAEQFRSLNQFLAMNLATSVRELKEAQDTYQGIPWVNTMAADVTGEAYYADHSVVPNVTDDQAQNCISTTATGQIINSLVPGLYMMDGRRSACEWGTDEDAVAPGIFGPGNLPHLFNRTYVHNANDSYWLSQPETPLTGFNRIIGDEATERTLRTRMGLIQLDERIAGTDGLDDEPGLTRETLEEMLYGNRALSTELALEPVTERCRTDESAGTVPATACDALDAFSGRYDIDQPGGLLWRRFWEHLDAAGGPTWETPFDAAEPINTPRGFDASTDEVGEALVAAVADLDEAGIPHDELWGDSQGVDVNGVHVPVPGTTGDLFGSFNYVLSDWIPGEGLSDVYYGSSHIQAVAFTGTGCPDASTLLTYSESTDDTNPHHGDQNLLFAAEEWVDFPFCADEILADPGYEVVLGDAPTGTSSRLADRDRIATAIEVSRRSHATPSAGGTVVIARADSFADALAGAPLARSENAPVLITGGQFLDDRVAAEIARLGADTAILLGGEAALTAGIATSIEGLGLEVERIAGESRADTARLIADRIGGDAAYLVNGNTFPDAISAGWKAATEGVPILLTNAASVPEETTEALAGRTAITIVGGEQIVTPAVAEAVAGDGVTVTRVSGDDRYRTGAALLPDGPVDSLWIATGTNWPDALAAGPAAAAEGAALLIVETDLCAGFALAALEELSPDEIVIVGGEAVVSADAALALRTRRLPGCP